MTDSEQKRAAKEFAEFWKDKGYEKGQSQTFWLSLLANVYGVTNPEKYIDFEEQVHIDKAAGFIDGYIKTTRVLIEQKSIEKDLRKAIKQSDGSYLTPFQQAKRYSAELPYDDRPRWIVTSNFKSFLIYDMNHPTGEPEEILLKDLEKDYYRLQFLVEEGNTHIKKELEVSVKAGELIGQIYDAMLKQYKQEDINNGSALKSLNKLCVRIVFCLYAEDAGIFGKHDMFHDYVEKYDANGLRKALKELFLILNTKEENRDAYLEDELAQFPYVNGGLFAEEVDIPPLTNEIRDMLLEKASADFDWSLISPTIFGAVFESTLNPETRRAGGMHYTSIENIHKVIDPLFLDSLKRELEEIEELKQPKIIRQRVEEYQNKLASLKFLDPACGSGNFLTESYMSLRKLENEAIAFKNGLQIELGMDDILNPIKVNINQFYGIEINDFAVTVATTALWIAESQMLEETKKIIHKDIDFLPLKSYTNIVEANALRIEWNDILQKNECDYIMGNPPFVGARLMSDEQKTDLTKVFGSDWKNGGNLDFVSCWFKKSFDYIKNTNIKVALVSTNSIVQGESVEALWEPLFKQGMEFDFAYKSFRWDSEASIKAHVYCVIIGFSTKNSKNKKDKFIYAEGTAIKAQNINGYLIDFDDIFVSSRTTPICNGVPMIGIGNKPIDDGNYLFTPDEMIAFIKQEPLSEKYFKPWYGADEFIKGKKRFCLWLGDCEPTELRAMPECMKRIANVKEFREKSKSAGTRKLAEKPTHFHVENMPSTNYLLIPRVSSENRRYVPIGFMDKNCMCSDSVHITTSAGIYDFGILTSNVHNAWMRVVCGRLETRYRYSKEIVYNNFPWPAVTDKQKEKIEHTAQMILDARLLYPNSSLADLYDELTMPVELRKAHQENDKAVMEAYGFDWHIMTESDCVAKLMNLYKEIVDKTNSKDKLSNKYKLM